MHTEVEHPVVSKRLTSAYEQSTYTHPSSRKQSYLGILCSTKLLSQPRFLRETGHRPPPFLLDQAACVLGRVCGELAMLSRQSSRLRQFRLGWPGPLPVRLSQRRLVSSDGAATKSARPGRWPRLLLLTAAFALAGAGCEKVVEAAIQESSRSVPGSAEDERKLDAIRRSVEARLPLVERLRNDPDHVECEVYESFTDEDKTHRLTSGPLAGSRGLALQVRFPGLLFFSFFWQKRLISRRKHSGTSGKRRWSAPSTSAPAWRAGRW